MEAATIYLQQDSEERWQDYDEIIVSSGLFGKKREFFAIKDLPPPCNPDIRAVSDNPTENNPANSMIRPLQQQTSQVMDQSPPIPPPSGTATASCNGLLHKRKFKIIAIITTSVVVIAVSLLWVRISSLAKVEHVMTFLKNGDINSGPYYFSGKHINQYSDFIYNERESVLSYTATITDISRQESSLCEWAIYLKTAKPVVTIETFESSPETLRIKVVGKCKMRSAASKEQLAVATFQDENSAGFLVNKEIGPRLKTALEDLLKAHKVEVSAY